MPLVLQGATSGQATLTPTDAQTVTLTLPATTGTLAVSGGSPSFATLTVTGDASISGLTVGKGGGAVASNTAFGVSALNSGSAGTGNAAFGTYALVSTTGANNSAFGYSALSANTSGNNNVSVGNSALASNTTASNNTAVGYQAGYATTTGDQNVFIGYQAGLANTTGNWQTIVGQQAGKANTTGVNNTFIGQGAGYQNTTGSYNTYVGPRSSAAYGAGELITTGTRNSIFGGYNGNQDSLDIRTASNYVVLSDGDGNRAAFWQSGGGWVQKNNSTSWSTFSDQRIKENVKEIAGLDIISALHPVEFDYKIGEKLHDIGFIAQEYKQVLPDQVIEIASGGEDILELTKGEPLLTIQQNLVPYLVKAIQELKATVDAQAARIASLEGAK